MAKFNWQELKWAKNINDVSTEVGIIFMRKSWTDWEYVEVPSTSNVNLVFDPTNIVDLKSESRGTALKVKQDTANVTFDLMENAGMTFIADILGLTKTATTAWAKTITNRLMTFADWVIEFKEISNDGLGVTAVVVKSADGVTTYVSGTDYDVVKTWNITRIVVDPTGALEDDSVVSVSWTVNLNAQEAATFTANYAALAEFDMRIAFEKMVGWVAKYRMYQLNPVTLNSTYTLPFLNAVEAGSAQVTSLQFDLSEQGTIEMINEVI